jgi:hypothetical protein
MSLGALRTRSPRCRATAPSVYAWPIRWSMCAGPPLLSPPDFRSYVAGATRGDVPTLPDDTNPTALVGTVNNLPPAATYDGAVRLMTIELSKKSWIVAVNLRKAAIFGRRALASG